MVDVPSLTVPFHVRETAARDNAEGTIALAKCAVAPGDPCRPGHFGSNRSQALPVNSLHGRGALDRAHRWAVGRRPRGDRGTAAIELVIVTPVVIVLLLTVVALGRYSFGKLDIEQASAAAARAAALTSSPTLASAAAQQAAQDSLDGSGVSCTNMTVSVDTGAFRPGGLVSVTLSCTADLSSLALAGVPGSVTVDRTSTAPLETYRQFGATR